MEALHSWFQSNRRSFPWREERTPYKVWISEVMLQQTRASVVVPYFLRWMELFPDVKDLAAAPIEAVIKTWEGLGYYSRARNLHIGAKQICERFGGEIPDSVEALASIRGLGPYTIGAILSFGFSQRAVAVDGNVARVVSRYFALEENICRPKVRRSIEEKTSGLLDAKEPWTTGEALIELGALVCRPMPLCEDCPLQSGCLGLKKGIAASLPIKNAESPVILLSRAVAVVESQTQFLVRKGEAGKVMADLYEFPYFDLQREATPQSIEKQVAERFGFQVKCSRILKQTAHTFTRYKARLYPFLATTPTPVAIAGWEWIPKKCLLDLPFSAGHRTIARQLL